jgi:3-hydroxybutyrate dehydrogenase
MTTARVVDLDLSGRTAMVTGAGSGIGRACARRLSAAGATVLALDLDAEAAARVAEETGGRAIVADLSELDRIGELPGAVDVLVNNAGLQVVAPITEFPDDRFSLIQRVMAEAPYRLVKLVLPHMYARGWGRIVNISSVHGLLASPYKAAYVTAKHALEGLSKVTALEAAPHGVTSNCVNPAFVRTPLVDKQIADQATVNGISESEVVERIMLDRAAIKKLIEPDTVAELLAYLCTPAADMITGSSITIDGGWTAH